MAVSIRSYQDTETTANPITVGLPASTAVGDVVLLVHLNDFYLFSDMGTPTGGPSTWALVTSADGGTNLAHSKAYVGVVDTAGAQTISITETGSADEDKVLAAYVLTGVDTTTPTDGAAGNTGGNVVTQVAPSVSPTTGDAFLVCAWGSGGGSSAAGYSTPAGMTEQAEFHATACSGMTAVEQLSASGATGTRTTTADSATPWCAISVAVRTASGQQQPTPVIGWGSPLA